MSLTDAEFLELEELVRYRQIEDAREHLLDFTEFTLEGFDPSPFHENYYEVLNEFCEGSIKKLIVSVPPQHGKSEGSSRRLPAYMLGRNPNLRIALASYNSTFAKKFNRDVQRIIDLPIYNEIFSKTTLNKSNVVSNAAGNWLRNSEEFEVVDQKGSFKAVGVGGGLTGNPVDVMIMDDLYKDYQDASSPVVSESVWDWYTTVVKTRLHNDSQELIVFTRWDDKDLVGRLEKLDLVVLYDGKAETIKNLKPHQFLKINFEAIKESERTPFDNRRRGQVLWPSKHSLEKLKETRDLDPSKFSALFQGQPKTKEGLMYSEFDVYSLLPDLKIKKSYTDTADTGKDSLCSIVYGVPLDKEDKKLYIVDVLFTTKSMEESEPLCAKMLEKNQSRQNVIESNNGGRSFARNIDRMTDSNIKISWFHQSLNKKARIFSNSASVNRQIVFPKDWATKWPAFYEEITNFKKDFTSKHDDSPDALTGVYETEFAKKKFYVV